MNLDQMIRDLENAGPVDRQPRTSTPPRPAMAKVTVWATIPAPELQEGALSAFLKEVPQELKSDVFFLLDDFRGGTGRMAPQRVQAWLSRLNEKAGTTEVTDLEGLEWLPMDDQGKHPGVLLVLELFVRISLKQYLETGKWLHVRKPQPVVEAEETNLGWVEAQVVSDLRRMGGKA
jgi:hypothetical protein